MIQLGSNCLGWNRCAAVPILWLAAECCGLGGVTAANASPVPPGVSRFLQAHCSDCHARDEPAGGFVLADLFEKTDSRETGERWVRVHERIAAGEMPPPELTLPESERTKLLTELNPWLTETDRQHRKTVQRRLNRNEYQNTLHDLLGIETQVAPLLPEDQQAGGFDNNGQALAISAELMSQYLEVARTAIDAALVSGPQPAVETFTVSARDEVDRYIPDQYRLVDDHIVMFTSTKTDYSKISTRQRRLPLPGRYRFEFTAFAHQSDRPRVFSVVASNFAGVSAVSRHLGYFEAPPTKTRFTMEATLDAKFAIQFFLQDFPGWLHGGLTETTAGIGFSDVTITGPLNDTWPPERHTRLVGSVDIDQVGAADVHSILTEFLPRAFRRPVTAEEQVPYVELFENRCRAGRSPRESLKIVLAAVLCSPHFLYLNEPEDSGTISDPALASRLSYFLWRSQPDQELRQLAAANQLHHQEILRSQVRRLLQDQRAQRFVNDFTSQWLHLRDINSTTPDQKLYPDFDELLQYSMVEESRQYFSQLLNQNRPFSEFLTADYVIVNERLARHYEIPGVAGLSFRRVSVPAGNLRGGILTQGAVLKVTANGTNTSPVIRGHWVLENILGQTVPPPPPNIQGIEPDIREATTIREQLALHRDVESCQACHRKIDPPGFALETFDPVGKQRTHYLRFFVNPAHADKGWGRVLPSAPVDASGEFSNGQKFADFEEFRSLLVAQEQDFQNCLISKLLSFSLGREAGFADRDAIRQIGEQTELQGKGFRSLIEALVLHPVFRSP